MSLKEITFILSIFILALVTNLALSSLASAATWNAGNIIDDTVFTNKSSMTVEEIQNFLNSKVPACDTYHARSSSQNDPGPPYTCLKSYTENGRSSAQIIYDAAQQYSINPQVFIVLLQKEQGLITDTWPWPIQYRSATGYGCPDTAACDSQYYGLTNQIYWAGRMFRSIVDANPNWYTPYVLGNNYIRYNPVSACGGSNVNIQNRSTQALYNYTPYQPNQAALDAGWGEADCGAYGNRNFWLYFTNWFGSTQAMPRDAQISSISNNGGVLEYGETRTVTVTATNLGTETWCSDGSCPAGKLPTRLVAQDYAAFGLYDSTDTSWVSNAQVRMQTPSVAPGQTGTFTFRVKGPYANGYSTSSRFYVLVSSTTFAPRANLWVGGSVIPTRMQLVSNSVTSNTVAPNQQATATVTIRNTSKTVWYSDAGRGPNDLPMRLVTPGYSASPYYDKSDTRWVSPAQIAMKTPVVNPGQDGVFEFSLKGPFQEFSSYNFKLLPVINGNATYSDLGIATSLTTPAPKLTYSYVSATPPPPSMAAGTTAAQKVTLTLRNTGNVVWRNETAGALNRVRLVMIFPRYRTSPFYTSADPAWLSPAQIAMKTPVVNPGEDGVFEFSWKAPTAPGNYLEYFSLVMDGAGFFPEYGSAFRTIVN